MSNQQEKRTAKGGGTVRQRPDGRWEARCTINGKSRSFYADKQSEALKKMREALKAQDDGIYLKPSKMTVEQWLSIWVEEYCKPAVKEATYTSHKGAITNHINPVLGKINLQQLNSTQIQKLYNDLYQKKNLQPITIRDIHGTLRTALKQALKLRYILVNPTDACVLPKIHKKEIKPLTEEEIVVFLKAIKASQFEKLFFIALFTGMREGEILGLPWDAVDFKNGTITVKQQLCVHRSKQPKGERIYIGTTKNNKSRTLSPAPFVMQALKEVQRQQLAYHYAVGTAWQNNWNLVFTDRDGKYISHLRIYSHFKRIAKEIGRPDARFHDLRHTYAVTALQEGDNPKIVQENLGHATAEFTMNVYAHISEKMKQDSANRMQAYFEKLMG